MTTTAVGNTAQTVSGASGEHASTADPPRPGSRADRMARPLARDVLKGLAEHHQLCIKPLALRRTDHNTGKTDIIDIPCGARLASDCKPCAERNRKLRQRQIREGWHLADEPEPAPEPASEEVLALVRLRCQLAFDRWQAERAEQWDQVANLDQGIAELDEHLATKRIRGTLETPGEEDKQKKNRSTKRRDDVPDLPRIRRSRRTTGKVYTGTDGTQHRPSTLLTITLGSYGPVHTGARTRRGRLIPCGCGILHADADPLLGTPIDPTSYDYRRAARDAVFFAPVLDRFWQNLRRCGGYTVQYAGAVEQQRRLAPHAHFAMRGTLPRALVKQVAAATYKQIWWPNFDQPKYRVTDAPVFDVALGRYVDPVDFQPLTTWTEALQALDAPQAAPAYTVRLGTVDVRGISPGTQHAERGIRYITKYLIKDLAEQVEPVADAQQAHLDRLHDELSRIPCSPSCANWLLYGIEPKDATHDLVPGYCTGKVHQRRTLGYTGRRVLISRRWSGKTLADHRADNRAWVRAVLAGAIDDTQPDHENGDTPCGSQRVTYAIAHPGDPDVPSLQTRLMRAIALRERWRTQLDHARQPAEPPPDAVSATQDHNLALAA